MVDLNNALAQLPYGRLEKSLDYLKSLDSYNKFVIDLKSAQGIDLSEEDYNRICCIYIWESANRMPKEK